VLSHLGATGSKETEGGDDGSAAQNADTERETEEETTYRYGLLYCVCVLFALLIAITITVSPVISLVDEQSTKKRWCTRKASSA
jgi:hypothetical protein